MDEPALFACRCSCPPKAPSETEATIIEWHVAEGDRFQKGEVLAQIDSASRSSISRPLATAWRCGSFTWKAKRSP